MTKNVLITGATGFVGRECLPLLCDAGYEVHAATRGRRSLYDPRVQWHVTDLLDKAQVVKLMSRVKPSHLLHLAWYSVPGRFWTSPQNLQWLQASLDLIQEFVARGGKRVVAAGSCAEYSWDSDGILSEASTPIAPATLYGACKHAVHTVFEAFARQNHLSLAWGRIFFLYGPREHPDRLAASVIRALLRGEPARCSHGRQVRDFLFVHDAASALVAVLQSKVSGAVNIASGQGVEIGDLAKSIGDLIGRPELIRFGERAVSANDPPVLIADLKRLRDEVGWQPEYSLDAGLRAAIDWWMSNPGNGGSQQNAADD